MKDIKGYEGLYAITTEGDVYSYKYKKFLKPRVNHKGYLYVNLWKDGKVKTYSLHRLVAEAYIPNPDNLPQVDHIDENKTHNYVNNLRWITQRNNIRKSKNIPILQYSLDGELIREWEFAYYVGKVAVKSINNCLKGRNKTAYGFIWKYKEDI